MARVTAEDWSDEDAAPSTAPDPVLVQLRETNRNLRRIAGSLNAIAVVLVITFVLSIIAGLLVGGLP